MRLNVCACGNVHASVFSSCAFVYVCACVCVHVCVARERERERERQTDRQTDRQRERDRQTDKQRERERKRDRERERERQTDRERERQTDRQTDRERKGAAHSLGGGGGGGGGSDARFGARLATSEEEGEGCAKEEGEERTDRDARACQSTVGVILKLFRASVLLLVSEAKAGSPKDDKYLLG